MSVLEQLQADIAGKIESDSFFADVSVFQVREATVETRIDQVLAGVKRKNNKSGLAIGVLMPTVTAGPASRPTLDARVTVRVYEIPIVNLGGYGTNISAEDCVAELLPLFQNWYTGSSAKQIVTAEDAAVPNFELVTIAALSATRITYDVNLRALLALDPVSRVTMPTITNAGGNITLACATAGASIYYSTNGTLPYAASESSTLYSAPFTTPVSGTQIRVAAYKPNLSGSSIAELTI